MNYSFKVKNIPINISKEVIIGILAVIGLAKNTTLPSGSRVWAIKLLRTAERGLGLYEAKQIVDWLADNGSLAFDQGVILTIDPPMNVVEYIGAAP